MNKIANDNLISIVNDARNGVDGAFEKLYKETIRFSYGVASVLLKNEEDIEDVLQSSYMYVAKSIKDLKNPESFDNWLSVIVRHECGKHIAKQNKSIDIFTGLIAAKDFDFHSEGDIPYELIEKRDLYQTVRDIVDKLPEDKRICIFLYYFERNTLSEISEILGIPEGTVKSRLHKGRKLLEKEFNKLKKKDETLYGVSILPLVAAFFAYQIKNATVPIAVSEGTAVFTALAEVGASASVAVSTSVAGGAVTGSATAGAQTVAGAAGSAAIGVTTKVAAVAVAAAVATGGTAATINLVRNKNETESTLPLTSLTEEYTTAPSLLIEETFEIITETSDYSDSTLSVTEKNIRETSEIRTVTEISLTNKTDLSTQEITRKKTTKKFTTVPETTAYVSTVVYSSSKPESTTEATTDESTTTPKKTTTVKETTTKKETTTVKSTTTVKTETTTDATNLFRVSGGVLSEYTGEGGVVSVPSTINGDNISSIGSGAFAGNSDITSVSLPSSVTKIGQEAFSECTGLKSISLPSSLISIGIGAFCGCEELSVVTVPSGVLSIGDDAFAECSSLSVITIPPTVTTIGDNAFGGCENVVIKCSEGSAAHDYAVENSISFELI